MEQELTHFDGEGKALMVDVSGKEETKRTAIASGKIKMNQQAYTAIVEGSVKKGDVLGVARIAGIMAVKRTATLIPLCHPISTEKTTLDFEVLPDNCVQAICTVTTSGKTGVEMEALTGVTVALLTIYDMCKAVDKEMEMFAIRLEEKIGGKSGHFKRAE